MKIDGEEQDPWPGLRKFVRKRVIWIGYISCPEGSSECIVKDVSAGGTCIRLIDVPAENCRPRITLDVGTLVKFEVIGLAHARARIAWREQNVMGLNFLHVPDWAAGLA